MKILIVIDDFYNKSNGMCISTQRFAREFSKMGRSVRIVTCAINGENPDYPVKEMIIPFFKKIIAKEGFHMAVPSKKVLTKAVDWADSVMIETPFPLSFRAAKIAKKMGKPVAGTFHIFPGNITEPLHINNRFWNSFFLCFFKNCDAIQCPTIKVKNMQKSIILSKNYL